MADKSEIAIYISLGSLVVSSLSFLFAVSQSRNTRKIERAKVYDKVYHDASDLLLYHYKKKLDEPFVSDDKELEKAVNEFGNAHWLEQMYGFNTHAPDHLVTDADKAGFRKKVSEAYYAHQHEKQVGSCDEFINHQSPVFHLSDEEFANRFNRLIVHVTQNLSFFSPIIVDNWEKMRLLKPEKVKNEYLALKRVNEHACEAIEEPVEDPYLRLLLSIRHEYRELNKPFKTKWSEFWFNLTSIRYRIKCLFNKKRQWDV